MDNRQDETDDVLQTYPSDISYQRLKNKRANYSFLYGIWVDAVYILTFVDYWFSAVIYPLLLLYIFLRTRYWYSVLVYILWLYYDRETPHNGGRKINFWPECFISKYVREYHPVGLVKTANLSNDKNYLCAVFPHGVFCCHGTVNFVNDTHVLKNFYPNIDFYPTTLNINFQIPIIRDTKLSKGLIAVSERSLITSLTNKPNSGTAVLVVVGGAAESFHCDSPHHKLTLENRKGFVRIALKTGASLVPIFGFGENYLYDLLKVEWLTKIQYYLYKLFGVAPLIPLGRRFGLVTAVYLPKCSPLITVVGKPIDLPKIENPTKEEIDYYHGKFKEELSELFEKFKEKYDPAGKQANLIYV